MGNPSLRAASGLGVDQVVRRQEFAARHPEVTITTPRQNGTLRFRATWLDISADPARDGQPVEEGRVELRDLLDYLEARFDR